MNRKSIAVLGVLALAGAGAALAVPSNNALSVTTGAALEGTYGLEVYCAGDASDNNIYVESNHPNNETHYKASFLIRPHTLNLPTGSGIRISNIITNPGGQSILLFLRHNASNNWALKLRVKDETLSTYKSLTNLSLVLSGAEETTKMVTIEWQTDSSNGATDGYLKITRCNADGVTSCTTRSSESVITSPGIDNETMLVDYIRIGILNSTGPTCAGAGSYNFDSFASYR